MFELLPPIPTQTNKYLLTSNSFQHDPFWIWSKLPINIDSKKCVHHSKKKSDIVLLTEIKVQKKNYNKSRKCISHAWEVIQPTNDFCRNLWKYIFLIYMSYKNLCVTQLCFVVTVTNTPSHLLLPLILDLLCRST